MEKFWWAMFCFWIVWFGCYVGICTYCDIPTPSKPQNIYCDFVITDGSGRHYVNNYKVDRGILTYTDIQGREFTDLSLVGVNIEKVK